MIDDDDFKLSPPWKDALRALLREGLVNGEYITKEHLCDLFGLQQPKTIEDKTKFDFRFLDQFTSLRDELLSQHRIALKTMQGSGTYQIIPPNEQTTHAMETASREIGKAMTRTVRTLGYIRYDELTDEERTKNANARSKIAMLASMMGAANVIDSLPEIGLIE